MKCYVLIISSKLPVPNISSDRRLNAWRFHIYLLHFISHPLVMDDYSCSLIEKDLSDDRRSQVRSASRHRQLVLRTRHSPPRRGERAAFPVHSQISRDARRLTSLEYPSWDWCLLGQP